MNIKAREVSMEVSGKDEGQRKRGGFSGVSSSLKIQGKNGLAVITGRCCHFLVTQT